ncbi:hypothetical protein B484DRAFT_94614, partial [Ochromonadaceae sp. CCMP2298]
PGKSASQRCGSQRLCSYRTPSSWKECIPEVRVSEVVQLQNPKLLERVHFPEVGAAIMSDLKRRWAGCSVSAEDRVIVIASISCFFACLSQGCGISIVASSVSEMAQIAGVEVTEFGTVFFAGGIGFLVGCLCCSSLLDAGVVDGVPKHYLCCVAATLAGLATVLLMHTSSFHMMALYVLVQVFGFGGVHLFSTLAIQEMWGQRVQPWLQMKATCGGVGGIVGPVMVAHWGYRRACLGGALLCLTPLLVIALLLAWQMWQVQGRVSQVPLESQVCAPTSEAQGLRQGLGLGLEQGLGLGVLSSIDENGYDTTPPTLTSIPTTAAVASTPTPTPTPASTPTPSALEFLYGGARAAYVATEILQIERGMRRAVRHRSATLPYSGAGTSSSTASCPAPNSLALFPSLFRAEGRAASFRSGSDLCTLEQQQLQQQQSGNQTQRDFPFKLRMPQQAEEGEEGEMGGAGMTGETGTLSSPRPILHLSPCPSSRPSPRLKPRGGPQSNSPHKDGDVEDNRGRRFSVDDYLPADGEYGEYEDTDREYGGGCRGSVDASGGLCVEVDVEDGDGNGDGDGDGDGDLFSDESTPLTKAFGVAGRRRMSFGSMGEGQEQTQMQTQRSGRSRTLSFATPEIVASLGLLQDSGIVLVPFAFRGILGKYPALNT